MAADPGNEGRLGRLARLGGLGARVTGSYLGQKVREALGRPTEAGEGDALHLRNAKDIAEQMRQMRGAAMKIGQQLALYAGSFGLPDDVTEVLGTLNAKAEPVPFDVIRQEVERELDGKLEALFSWFDPVPLGTASLGQAHAARLSDGREVVVKVLHRGVEASMSTDLLALKGLLMSSRAMRRTKEEIDDIFDELRDRLVEELDYVQEAANIQTFTRIYGNDPRVRIPRVHVDRSTSRVLTLDRLPGVPIETFLQVGSPEARRRAGLTLGEIYFEQVYEHRVLHSDPHPGNYLFELDGRVGLLDFGCVKRIDEFWIATYARTALACVDARADDCVEGMIDLGFWDGKGDDARKALWALADGIGVGFRKGEVELGTPEETLLRDLTPLVTEILRYPNIRASKEVIMVHRTLGGLYTLAGRLHASADWGALAHKWASRAIARAEGRKVDPIR
jgi:predicted unusual protein kinase regulating ubiquinone biosynthesis (AarF/ABC1/UbiB family)